MNLFRKYIFFFLCSVQGISASNYVTICRLDDQFGGQLFYTAMVLGIAWENKLDPIFSKDVFLNAPNGQMNYDWFFNRFFQENANEIINHSFLTHPYHHLSYPFSYNEGNLCLCGIRTETWYFKKYLPQIREAFRPSDQVLQEIDKKYPTLFQSEKTVAVHVRTYHPVRCTNHLFLGAQYYNNAMKKFSKDHLFIVFSDRIDWCKKHLKVKNRKIIFIEGNNHIVDFFLMTKCKNIIAANSTFSLWAAYLKENSSGRILVPSIWSQAELNNGESDVMKRELYLPTWEVIPVTNVPPPDNELLSYETTSVREKD